MTTIKTRYSSNSNTCTHTLILSLGLLTANRPTIGAPRLIAIDSQSLLGGQWTLQKATEYREERKKKVEVTIITFRNDLLSKAQKKLLETTDAAPKNGDNTTLNDGACPKPLISSFRMPKAKVAEKAQNDKKPVSAFFRLIRYKIRLRWMQWR